MERIPGKEDRSVTSPQDAQSHEHAEAAPYTSEALCPECRVNQVEPPFFYCSLCEMLNSYFTNKVATPEQLKDKETFHAALEAWRATLTWQQILELRDTYWMPLRNGHPLE